MARRQCIHQFQGSSLCAAAVVVSIFITESRAACEAGGFVLAEAHRGILVKDVPVYNVKSSEVLLVFDLVTG